MLTLLKGLLKGAIISSLAMFILLMVLLGLVLGPVLIPFLVILLIVGALGILDWKCVIKPIASGIIGIFKKLLETIQKVLSF